MSTVFRRMRLPNPSFIQVVWEKGGPGIVWHMDANFWKEEAGGSDLDEATDDWDVDMSIYYDEARNRAGDKDSRDFLQMRKEAQFRTGDAPSIFGERESRVSPETTELGVKTGDFEKHTKGIGRKVLEKNGWKEGRGIGKWREGDPQIIDSQGQLSYSKKGLGFYGQSLKRHHLRRQAPLARIHQQAVLEPGQGSVRITTCYDPLDQGGGLKRRAQPTNLRRRSAKM